MIAPPSLPPLGLTFLEDDGLAQLLRADGEILLLTGGDDGLQVIVAFLQGSRATECGLILRDQVHTQLPEHSPSEPGQLPAHRQAGRADRQQNREVLEELGAGVAWEQRSSSACCLLPHLDGISALLLSLGVRPAALVLV